MPWNGIGTFTPDPTSFPEVDGTLIEASRFNNTILDLAAGINNALTRDGQTTPTGNMSMAGYKHTNVAPANAANQYIVYGQTNAQLAGLTVTNPFLASDGAAAAPAYAFSGDTDTGLYKAGTNILGFSTAGAYRGEITAGGVWQLGTLEGQTAQAISAVIPKLLTFGTAFGQHDIGLIRYNTDASGPNLRLAKVKSTTQGAVTAVAGGDTLGNVTFNGADAVSIAQGAAIGATATQTWTSTAHGTRLGFFMPADGETANAEVVRMSKGTGLQVFFGGIYAQGASGFIGNGSQLTSLPAAQLTGTVASDRLNTSYTNIVNISASGTIAAGSTMTATGVGDGATLMNLVTERSWAIRQRGAGASAQLSFENGTSKSIGFSSEASYSGAQIVLSPTGPGTSFVYVDGYFQSTGNAVVGGAVTATGDVTGANLNTSGLGLIESLRAGVGSAAAPSISFAADGNTGFYRQSNDVMGITGGGVQFATLSAGGLLPTINNSFSVGNSSFQLDNLYSQNIFRNGAQVRNYVSGLATVPSTTGITTFTHNYGVKATAIQVFYQCQTSEHGYSVGDEIDVATPTDPARATQIRQNINSIFFEYVGSSAPSIRNSSGTLVALTPANWRLVAKGVWL